MSASIGDQLNNIITYTRDGFEYFKFHIRLLIRALFFRDISEYLNDEIEGTFKKLLSFWFINLLLIYLIALKFDLVASALPFDLTIKMDIPIAQAIFKYLPTILTRHILGLIVFCYILRMGFTKQQFGENKTKLIKIFLISSTFILFMFIYKMAEKEIFQHVFEDSLPDIYVYYMDYIRNGLIAKDFTSTGIKIFISIIFLILSSVFWYMLWFIFLVVKVINLNIIIKNRVVIPLIKAIIFFILINVFLIYFIEGIEVFKRSSSSRIIMFNKIENAISKENPNYVAAANFASIVANDNEIPDILRFYALIKVQVLRTAILKHTNPEFKIKLNDYMPFITAWRYNDNQKRKLNFRMILLELRGFIEKQMNEYPDDEMFVDVGNHILEELLEAEKIYKKNNSFKAIIWTKQTDNQAIAFGLSHSYSKSMVLYFNDPIITLELADDGGDLILHNYNLRGNWNKTFFSIFENLQERNPCLELAESSGESIKQEHMKNILKGCNNTVNKTKNKGFD